MRPLVLLLLIYAVASQGGVLAMEGEKLELSERIFNQVVVRAGEFSDLLAFLEFNKQVGPENRLPALVAIWDHPYADPKDSITARSRVCGYLSQHRELRWDSYPPLCLRIHSGLLSPEARLRNGCWQWLAFQKGPEYVRPLLIAALSDTDEGGRCSAVYGLAELGDALPLLEEYVRQNQDDPRWKRSVPQAKAAIEKARREKEAGKTP